MDVEVILKTKVPALGAEADLVSVRPGYARNYLIPRGYAVLATAASKQQLEQLKKKRAEREAQELNEAQELAQRLSRVKLTFTLTGAAGQEKVFGSVTTQDIAQKLKEEGFEIDRKKIQLPRAIKDSGDHEVAIQLHPEVVAKVRVAVEVPQSGDKKSDKKAKPKKTADGNKK
ncbi:MAG: 50S ribosomal protein L9 [Methylacidiphilales bacterium]|nr:50S ribosomal protein L9 [Candidatus Methylacidiphilales bacterium]MDW8350183.1 50S ribosomal protein L9 [Verrucomicrobiae bacterium]